MSKYNLLVDSIYKHATSYIVVKVITLDENRNPLNISSDYNAKPNQHYENLLLQGHFHHDHGFTSHGIAYVDTISIDYRTVTAMQKTLKAINKIMDKLEATRFDKKNTFEQQLIDFAIAIKAEFILTYNHNSNESAYSASTYRYNDISNGAYLAGKMISDTLAKKA